LAGEKKENNEQDSGRSTRWLHSQAKAAAVTIKVKAKEEEAKD